MEHFYLEEPSSERKWEAIDYVMEHEMVKSKINGSGSLDQYLHNYELWLEKLEKDKTRPVNEEGLVPARTFFLIREEDNRIIGMINIRLVLNKTLLKSGGNIGYGIRPSERQKGYNKINLYLGLKKCQEFGINSILLDADLKNEASWKTMEALGGIRIKEYQEDKETILRYEIPVTESLEKYKDIYEPYVGKR